ncbi:host specificity factor TipJ family phage tail protein [Comamonadaceae bacterium PP-2]
MLTILYDPAGIAGHQRHAWDFSKTIQKNIEAHLSSGAGCKIRVNGREVDPASDPVMDRLPCLADFVTVVRRPEGAETFIYWAYAALAAVAIASYAMMPRVNNASSAAGKDSPNNSLTAQSNVAKAYQAIPDVYGYRRVWPDMIQPSTVEYIDHIKYVTEWLCISRGLGDITDVRYAETPIADISGASYEIFSPTYHTPYPENGSTFLYDVLETFESDEVNGQEITYSEPWATVTKNGSFSSTTGNTQFTVRVNNDSNLDQLKSLAGVGSAHLQFSWLVEDSTGSFSSDCAVVSFSISGSYCDFVFAGPPWSQTLENVSSSFTMKPLRTDYTPLGPYTLPVDADRIRWNTVFLRGLKYSIDVYVEWWKIDADGNEIAGTRQGQNCNYNANTYDPRFYTNEVTPAAGRGRYRVQFTRTTPQQGDQGTDLAKLEELYAVRHYPMKTLPGVTVIRLTTKATTEATGYSDRKFNLRWHRHVRTLHTESIGTSRNFARAMAHIWSVAGNDLAQLDVDALHAVNQEHGENSPLLRFDASLDDADMSLGERMQLAADAARCVIWRDGQKWTVVRDQARAYPELQLDYRNLAAGGESAITENAHLPASYDGIELEYVDEPSQSKKSYIRISVSTGAPVYASSRNPKKIKMTACATYDQANNRAQLEARKLLYQRTSVADTAMADAGSLGLGSLVRWIDPNDFLGDDGLHAGEVLSIAGNLIEISEPVDWKGQTEGRMLFTGVDGRHLGAPMRCFPSGDRIELEAVPAGLFVATADRQLGSRYAFAVGLTAAELEAAGLYTVTSVKPDSKSNLSLALVNYDSRIYAGD